MDLRLERESSSRNEKQVSKASVSNSRKNLEIRDPHDISSKCSTTSEIVDARTEFNNGKPEAADEEKVQHDDDEIPSPTTLLWEKTVAEVKEHTIAKLQDELKKAHDELKLKDEEVLRLSRFRQDVEQEVEELTASLFQVCT